MVFGRWPPEQLPNLETVISYPGLLHRGSSLESSHGLGCCRYDMRHLQSMPLEHRIVIAPCTTDMSGLLGKGYECAKSSETGIGVERFEASSAGNLLQKLRLPIRSTLG